MSNSALESQGMTLSVSPSGSPQSFVAIPEIRSIAGPDGQANWIDTTDLDSTSKEGRPGLKDNGSLRLSIHYLPDNAAHTTLKSAFDNRTLKSWQAVFTDSTSTTWEFDGYVLGFAIRNEVDGVTMADITIRITGDISEVS